MSKVRVACPACGSKKLKRHEKDAYGKIVLGKTFHYVDVYYACAICHEEGDFSLEADHNYSVAEKSAQAEFVRDAITEINNAGISMAFIERVFELPTRTLTRWKNGDFSASALALLRIILIFPWLVNVAEHKFEHSHVRKIIIHIAENAKDENQNQFDDNFSKSFGNQTIFASATYKGRPHEIN